jgi:glyoxylase-like metal-dependent hydrolase (beta-lactamase superfamily II)
MTGPYPDIADVLVDEVAPQIHRIPLPLPGDALHSVNVYAIVQDGDVTLIDAGWSHGPGLSVLEDALEKLGVGAEAVGRVLVTHMHRDHYTLGMALRGRYGTQILLGRGEEESLDAVMRGSGDGTRELLAPWGAETLLAELDAEEPPPPSIFEAPDGWIDGPMDLVVGQRILRAIPTPGHTRGHLVFADLRAGLLFSGDHVLPRITPSIGYEPVRAALPLADFMASLHLVLQLPDLLVLPAHGDPGARSHIRVGELLDFHVRRLEQTAEVVTRADGLSVMEVAQRLTWTRRDRRFDDLDVRNRLFAVAETAAHLDLLVRDRVLQGTAETVTPRCYR